jgi:4-alpha-glucanotransferase
MNRPGKTYGNWEWRLERGALTLALARRLGRLAERYARS